MFLFRCSAVHNSLYISLYITVMTDLTCRLKGFISCNNLNIFSTLILFLVICHYLPAEDEHVLLIIEFKFIMNATGNPKLFRLRSTQTFQTCFIHDTQENCKALVR